MSFLCIRSEDIFLLCLSFFLFFSFFVLVLFPVNVFSGLGIPYRHQSPMLSKALCQVMDETSPFACS